MHGIKKSRALFACAALPVLAWATPQELTTEQFAVVQNYQTASSQSDSIKREGNVSVASSASSEMPVQSAGRKVFGKWCADCHSTAQGPGSLALQRKYQGALPAVLEQRGNLPPEYVKFVVRHGMSFMPSFRKTEISDAELALLAAYLAGPQ